MTDSAYQNNTEALRNLVKRTLYGVHTMIPGVIVSFNASENTVNVQPAIRKTQVIDDEITTVDQPVLQNVAIDIPYAAVLGFSLTLPLSAGDPCMIVYSERSIDNWQDNGGIQNPLEPISPRAHDISDPIVIPGAIPTPNRISNYQTDAIEMRNADRSDRVTVKDDAVEIRAGDATFTMQNDGTITVSNAAGASHVLSSSGTVTMSETGGASITLANGAIQLTAPNGMTTTAGTGGLSISASGATITSPTLTHNGVNISETHVHGGVVAGGDNTDVPQ